MLPPRLLCHSTLGSRVIKRKKKQKRCCRRESSNLRTVAKRSETFLPGRLPIMLLLHRVLLVAEHQVHLPRAREWAYPRQRNAAPIHRISRIQFSECPEAGSSYTGSSQDPWSCESLLTHLRHGQNFQCESLWTHLSHGHSVAGRAAAASRRTCASSQLRTTSAQKCEAVPRRACI